VASKYFYICFQTVLSNVSLPGGLYAWKRNGEAEGRDKSETARLQPLLEAQSVVKY